MSLSEALKRSLERSSLDEKFDATVALAEDLALRLDGLSGDTDADLKEVAALGRLYINVLVQLGLTVPKMDSKGGGSSGNGNVSPLRAARDRARERRASAVGQTA